MLLMLLGHFEEVPGGANLKCIQKTKQNFIISLYPFLSSVFIHCLAWNTSNAGQDCMKKAFLNQNLLEVITKAYNFTLHRAVQTVL